MMRRLLELETTFAALHGHLNYKVSVHPFRENQITCLSELLIHLRF